MKHRSLAIVAHTAVAIAMPYEEPAPDTATGGQSYVTQLGAKTAIVRARFADLSVPEVEVFFFGGAALPYEARKTPCLSPQRLAFSGLEIDRLVLLVQV